MRRNFFKEKFFNEKGFILIETVFTAMILSFTAFIVVNGLEVAIRSERISVVKTNAVHLANARIAEIESFNENLNSFQFPSTSLTNEDLIYKNFFGINGTIQFQIDEKINSSSTNFVNVTIRVSWVVNGNENYSDGNNYEEVTKNIYFAQ